MFSPLGAFCHALAVSGLWCHSVELAGLRGASVCQCCFMPLAGGVACRLCGVWTIGNPASPVSHSKPLGVSGDTGIPYGANSVLAGLLRLAVAGLRVSAHTGRADSSPGADIRLTGARARARARAEMSPDRTVLSDGQACPRIPRWDGAARFSDAARSARFTRSARSETVAKSTLECC